MTNELLTREDLQQFRMQLLSELKEVLQQSKQSTKQWLKSSEVRRMLGISHGTLQNLRITRSLPYTKLGGIMFYRHEDIEKILEAGLVSKKYWDMDTPNQLSSFISRVASDERLKPTHISLYVALCHAWITNRFQQCYNVSRRQLMRLSRIQSKSTYHKTISDLASMGYIRYHPSYHPMEGSKVSLLGLMD